MAHRGAWSLMMILSVAACTTHAPAPPIHVSARLVGDECRLDVDGRRMNLEELALAAGSWRERAVRLDMDATIPYKCVGGALFALQRAGVKRIGFISEPPPPGRR